MNNHFRLAVFVASFLLIATCAWAGAHHHHYGEPYSGCYAPQHIEQCVILPPPSATIDEGVCVYDRPNFQGYSQCWGIGTEASNLGLSNWGDRIASVRVFGRARFVGNTAPNFLGDDLILETDVPDLSEIPLGTSGNWNDEISSLRID